MMNSKLISTEEAINRVLLGVSSASTPAGMEARIAARLLQAAEERSAPAQTRSGWRLACAAAAGIVLAVATAPWVLHRHQSVTGTLEPQQNHPTQLATATPRAIGQPRFALASQPAAIKTDNSLPTAEPAPDYDALALAETLAPSQAAAILPLTAQEQTLVQATRQGQPIEVAELDQVREPALRAAAAAREHRNLLHYVSAWLAPLAAFQSAQSDAPDDPQPSPDPNPQPQPLSPTASR
jgi:hypothetical protein